MMTMFLTKKLVGMIVRVTAALSIPMLLQMKRAMNHSANLTGLLPRHLEL